MFFKRLPAKFKNRKRLVVVVVVVVAINGSNMLSAFIFHLSFHQNDKYFFPSGCIV